MRLEKGNVVKITDDERKAERLKAAGFYEVDAKGKRIAEKIEETVTRKEHEKALAELEALKADAAKLLAESNKLKEELAAARSI